MIIAGSPTVNESLNGIGFAGGTLVAAGDDGEIYKSLNGTTPTCSPPTARWQPSAGGRSA